MRSWAAREIWFADLVRAKVPRLDNSRVAPKVVHRVFSKPKTRRKAAIRLVAKVRAGDLAWVAPMARACDALDHRRRRSDA